MFRARLYQLCRLDEAHPSGWLTAPAIWRTTPQQAWDDVRKMETANRRGLFIVESLESITVEDGA